MMIIIIKNLPECFVMFCVSHYCHPFSWSGYHGVQDEAEAEDCVRALLHGLPPRPRLCADAAW